DVLRRLDSPTNISLASHGPPPGRGRRSRGRALHARRALRRTKGRPGLRKRPPDAVLHGGRAGGRGRTRDRPLRPRPAVVAHAQRATAPVASSALRRAAPESRHVTRSGRDRARCTAIRDAAPRGGDPSEAPRDSRARCRPPWWPATEI